MEGDPEGWLLEGLKDGTRDEGAAEGRSVGFWDGRALGQLDGRDEDGVDEGFEVDKKDGTTLEGRMDGLSDDGIADGAAVG